jgi:hypothetical protein
VGPAYQPVYFFSSSARDALMGRPGVTCSAQLGCGLPCFFRRPFCLKSANFKFEYLPNYKPKLSETCTKNS